MSNSWADFLRLPAQMVELGLTVMDAGAKTVRQGLNVIAAPQKPRLAPNAPPVHGPQDLDTAIADFVNQMIRIGWVSSPQGLPIGQLAGDVLNSARRAFGYMDLRNPRTFALPFELPFSAGGIAGEALLRMMSIISVVGPKRLKLFMNNAAEVYVDTAVFIGLEYKEVIERYKDRLKERPDDSTTRLELGRMYVKCGLHDEAVHELAIAAQDPATRGRATHESALAHYRAGRYQLAVDDGVAAMTADPSNERARAAMWLATRSLGGYPETVPEEFRMELQAG